MGKYFWGVVIAAVELSRRKAKVVAQGDGKFGPWGWPKIPPNQKKGPCQWAADQLETGLSLSSLISMGSLVGIKMGSISPPITHTIEWWECKSGLCQNENTSSRAITEVKHLELNQFSKRLHRLGSGYCGCIKDGTKGCPLWYPFPLARYVCLLALLPFRISPGIMSL